MIYTPNTVDIDLELKFLSYLIFDDASNLFGLDEVDFSDSIVRKAFKELKGGAFLNHNKLEEIGFPTRFVEFMTDNQVFSSAEMERISGQLKGMSVARKRLFTLEKEKQGIHKATASELVKLSYGSPVKEHTFNAKKAREQLKLEELPREIKFEPASINEWLPYCNTKWVVWLIASTGVGKTTAAIQLSRSIADSEDSSTAYITLEMPLLYYLERAYTIMYYENDPVSDYPSWKKHRETLTSDEISRVAIKENEWIIDLPGMNMNAIKDQIRKIKKIDPKLKTVVIDHIYILGEDEGTKSEMQHQARIAAQLDELAKELDVRVIAIGQTRKGDDDGRFEEPTLEDLRGAKALSEIAWWTLGFWRDKINPDILYWKILKKRDGLGVGKKGIVNIRGTYMYDNNYHYDNPNY